MAIYKLGDICYSVSDTKKPLLPQKILNTSDIFMGAITPVVENQKVLGQFKKTACINDILFSEIRPGNGRWALVKEDISDVLISTKLLVLRCYEDIVLNKFLYILITNNLKNEIVRRANSRSGTFPQITFTEISDLEINVPSIVDQQKIIDIIEPFEKIQSKILELKQKILKTLSKNYEKGIGNEITFKNLINLKNNKRNAQLNYYQTNAIGEFIISPNKVIKLTDKIPSRADLIPENNSFIISKMIGENKVYFFDEIGRNDVFSTGFFNFTTKYIDYISGFLLSNSFKNQKVNLSNGTTMVGLNLEGLNNITIKNTSNQSYILTNYLCLINKINVIIETIINKLVHLYIK